MFNRVHLTHISDRLSTNSELLAQHLPIICSYLLRLSNHLNFSQCCNLVTPLVIMARRSARILENKLAKARKHQVSGPNSSHLFSIYGNLSLEQFPLMELPREVRDMIFEACLVFDRAIFVRNKRMVDSRF